MPQEISKSVFKAQALEIMRGVEETGNEVVITSHGKKALVIKRYKDNTVSPMEKLKGAVVSFSGPFSSVAEDDWELS